MRNRRTTKSNRRGAEGMGGATQHKGQHPHAHMAEESIPHSTPRRLESHQHRGYHHVDASSVDARLMNERAQAEWRKRYGSMG